MLDLQIEDAKLVIVKNINSVTKILLEDSYISYFDNTESLSFMQRDKYIYEFACLLKTIYGDIFKDDWVSLKTSFDENINNIILKGYKPKLIIDEWENNSIVKTNLTFKIHNNIVTILSPIYNKLIYYINEEPKSILKEINKLTGFSFLLEAIKDKKDKFFVNSNYSSYSYNEKTKLYDFNSEPETTHMQLKNYLSPLKDTVKVFKHFLNDKYSRLIIENIISNINDLEIRTKILDEFKPKTKLYFNNERRYEIAYKNKILNLRDGTKRERTHLDYYTTTINKTYIHNKNNVPKYIRSIFGDDEKELKTIQTLLGSLFTGSSLDRFVIFYGKGSNSKTKLILALKEIFNDFQLNIDYEKFIQEKHIDDKIDTFNMNQKRLIAIDDLNYKTFLKDESQVKRLISNRRFNFIATLNELPKFDNLAMKRRFIILPFPYFFIQKPLSKFERKIKFDLEINLDTLFTWLVKGAINHFKEQSCYKNNILKEIEIEKEKQYNSDDDDSSEEEFSNDNKIDINNPITSFKDNILYYEPGRVIKNVLYNLYINNNNDKSLNLKNFNKIIKEVYRFKEDKSENHNILYWSSLKLLDYIKKQLVLFSFNRIAIER